MERTELLEKIVQGFSNEDLRTLCFELAVDYENLGGEGKSSRARELILHLERRKRLSDLVAWLQKNRPELLPPPTLPVPARPTSYTPVPFLVSVGQKDDMLLGMRKDVTKLALGVDPATSFAAFGIQQTNLELFRAEGLEVGEWQGPVREFKQKVREARGRIYVEEEVNGNRIVKDEQFHLLLNCPLALAVGLGASLYEQYHVALYLFSGGYTKVLDTTTLAEGAKTLQDFCAPPYRHIRVTGLPLPAGTPNVFAALHPDSDNFQTEVVGIASATGGHVVDVRLLDAALKEPTNWVRVVQEIFSALNNIRQHPDVQTLHLCPTVRLPLGFALGMALGYHKSVVVYQREAELTPVFNLREFYR